eukprot:symbB.v1.2.004533.t1/scaffold256.1/size249868/4
MPKKSAKAAKGNVGVASDEEILRQRRRISAVQVADLALLAVSWGFWLLACSWYFAFDDLQIPSKRSRWLQISCLEDASVNLVVCGQFCSMLARCAPQGNWSAWRKPWYLALVAVFGWLGFLFFQAGAHLTAAFCGLLGFMVLATCPAAPEKQMQACDAWLGRALVFLDAMLLMLGGLHEAVGISWNRTTSTLASSLSVLPLLIMSLAFLCSSTETELLTAVCGMFFQLLGWSISSAIKEDYQTLILLVVLGLLHMALYLPLPSNDPESNPFYNSFKRSKQRCAKFFAQPVSGFGDENSGGRGALGCKQPRYPVLQPVGVGGYEAGATRLPTVMTEAELLAKMTGAGPRTLAPDPMNLFDPYPTLPTVEPEEDLGRRLLQSLRSEKVVETESTSVLTADPAIAAVYRGSQDGLLQQVSSPPPPPPPPGLYPLEEELLPPPPEPQSSVEEPVLVTAQSEAPLTDWLCRCGFRNRGSNSTCGGTGHLGCSLPRATGEFQEAGGALQAPSEAWVCTCGFRNRPTNTRCGGTGSMGCSTLRPDLEQKRLAESTEADATVGGPAPPPKSEGAMPLMGSWICTSCGWKNSAGNDRCGGVGPLGCKLPRREETEEVKKDAEAWQCTECGAENLGTEMSSCSSCQAPRRFKGVLKSVGSDYGFISCAETAQAYGRDVYVNKAILEAAFRRGGGASSGVSVSFLVSLNDTGQPNARQLIVLETPEDEERDLQGTVKYLSLEKGYGFIECQEIWDSYGADVHADYEYLRSCSLGQPVKFRIRLGQIGGRPQVKQLSIAGPPPSELPATSASVAANVVSGAWRRVLLLGEGDFSFASAAAILHQDCDLDATTVLPGRYDDQ